MSLQQLPDHGHHDGNRIEGALRFHDRRGNAVLREDQPNDDNLQRFFALDLLQSVSVAGHHSVPQPEPGEPVAKDFLSRERLDAFVCHGCWPPAQGRQNYTAETNQLPSEKDSARQPYYYGASVPKWDPAGILTFQSYASSLSEQKNNADWVSG